MGATEDDDDHYYRPETAGSKPDDAVDDAYGVCLHDFIIPQWLGSLLGDFKCYPDCSAVFCYWLGRIGYASRQ